MLDYARPNQVGFSTVVSLGSSAELDFGEILDYLVWDFRTEAILVYIEGIRDARRFLSALRAAARVKPVMVLKVGRHPVGSRAAQAHTGAMTGDDAVFDAALRRSGVVRPEHPHPAVQQPQGTVRAFPPARASVWRSSPMAAAPV